MARRCPAWLPIVAITCLGLAIRLYHLDFQSLWRDEVDVVRFSGEALPTLLQNFFKQGENGPLYYVIHHYWLGIFGDSESALRLPSVLFGAATVPVIYRLGRQLLDPVTATLGALLAAVSPYYVWYSQDAKMYPLLVLITATSFYLYLLALQSGRKVAWAGYVVATTIGLYTHFFFALVVLAQIVIFWLFFRDPRVRAWWVSMGLLTLPYLPLAIWEVPTLLTPPATAYPAFSPTGIATVLLVAFTGGFSPVPPALSLGLAVFMLASALTLYLGVDKQVSGGWLPDASRRLSRPIVHQGVAVLSVWVLAPLAGFILISMRLPLFTDRYLIIVTPAFYLVVAAGFVALTGRWRIALLSSLFLWLGISVYSLMWQSHTTIKSDFRSAAASFETLAGPGDLVIFDMPYVRYTFQYYYRGDLHWINAPYTNDGRSPEQIDRFMASEVGDRAVVWLVASEEELWDSGGLVERWLRRNLDAGEELAFPGVRLARYLPRE